MNVTAKEIANHAVASIDALLNSGKYRNESQLYRELGLLSDVSSSTIRYFHRGESPHPSTATLDKMIYGIKAAQRLHAA